MKEALARKADAHFRRLKDERFSGRVRITVDYKNGGVSRMSAIRETTPAERLWPEPKGASR